MKDLLKFITCGSVDDGKSTLIGHMLYDAKLLFADQAHALELDSRMGSRGGAIDYSLLLDGLLAEREQGITIDVAYRYFTTEKRSFIVADTPGHEEYTRNMAVGASFADLAVILVDATKGVLAQTKRHTRICSLMGIRHFIFAVNKMDLISYDQHRYDQIVREVRRLISEFTYDSLDTIPVSATEGDNITEVSANMLWYTGKPLLDCLECIEVHDDSLADSFYMPVQRVSRPNHTFRGFQGQVEAGTIRVGDVVTVFPSREQAGVKQIFVGDKEESEAGIGTPITLRLDHEVDISRGCVIAKAVELHVNSVFNASILWMDDKKVVPGRSYDLKIGTRLLPATIMSIKYKIDVNTGDHLPAEELYKNEIASCEIAASNELVLEAFKKSKTLGSLILIDRVSNMTSACGVVEHTLRRGNNVVWQDMDITRELRALQMSQQPLTLWFTGLSGSGKSTLANALEKQLAGMGKHTMLLDGDNVRMGLNRDLGFKEKDRIENIRRVAEVAKLMNDAGLIVLVSFISPFQDDRWKAREIIGECFREIYVNTPLEVCEERDVKGLYKKARAGEIPNFTGVTSPYEPPERADITIDTSKYSIEECVGKILEQIENN